MLKYFVVMRLVRDAHLYVKLTEDEQRVSYAQGLAEGHGRKYVGSLGCQVAEALGTDQSEQPTLVPGVDYTDVYHFVSSAIQLGAADDPLLQDIKRLREGELVLFEMGEDRQIDKRSGRMVDRANVKAVRVLEQAPARGPRGPAVKR